MEYILNHLIHIKEYKTPTKIRLINRYQQIVRADFENENNNKYSFSLNTILKNLSRFKCIIISDYGKGTVNNPKKIIALANKYNIPILIDPVGNNFNKYKNATILTPNLSEFENIVGICKSKSELVFKGQKLIKKLNLQALLITQGDQGMTFLEKNKKTIRIVANTSEVFDVTGAGDTVIATIGACISKGMSLADSCKVSNKAAEVVVEKFGTTFATISEILDKYNNNIKFQKGIITEKQLINNVKLANKFNKTVVMTNGCFDIVHYGHINYLNESKKLGDFLIVAVNSDKSVKQNK